MSEKKLPLDDAKNQLMLAIDDARKVKTPHELIEYVIKLYGVEFDKANAAIATLQSSLEASGELLAEQKRANDELFKLKQKTVIANRELMQKNKELFDLNTRAHQVITALREMLTDEIIEATARVQNEIALTASDNSDFAKDLATICDFIELYDTKTNPKHAQRDSADGDARADHQATSGHD